MEIALLNEAQYAEQMKQVVLPSLAACMEKGGMRPATRTYAGAALRPLANKEPLNYVCYDWHRFHELGVPGASQTFHGAVVLAHGFSEFAAKYDEMSWYFLLAGYSVCIMEQRGHGFSPHDNRNGDTTIWIDDWHRWVADLAKFCRNVGRYYAQGEQLALYAHSMGGGIAAAMLERYAFQVDKAVLSSPMIAPRTGAPNWLAGAVCSLACDLGRGFAKAPGQHEYSTEIDWERNQGASKARVEWYQSLRAAEPHYQPSAASNEWVRQALQMSQGILRPSMCARISVPVLLCQATNDVWVHTNKQDEFRERVLAAGGSMYFERFNACHAIFSMPNHVLAPYLKDILRFLHSGEKISVLE
ncbi:lysophospholipase [Bifidobacterium dolichotidis]|uniref:Lysophospholipase n=1 Tax=Bifidobacterium dolichotidis TaxID=2306976 RepID=A0A430FQY8_9BIFI|nr:alpha/beta fold hydrolase [Bifidobacterium dolichotidis]RSX55224.1 lysophospholipase [Bifidobacterium dolichotidis]